MKIKNWTVLQECLISFNECQLKDALNYELSHTKRACFIDRLHARYMKLRTARERVLLINGDLSEI